MRDIKTIAGLTFKIVVGVKIGKFFADVVICIAEKTIVKGLEALKEKIDAKIEEEKEPHCDMEVK